MEPGAERSDFPSAKAGAGGAPRAPGVHIKPFSPWAALCPIQHSRCMFHLQPFLSKTSCRSSAVIARPGSPHFQQAPSIATIITAGSGALPERVQPSQHLLPVQARSPPEGCLAAGRPQSWSAAVDLPWLSQLIALLTYQSVSWFLSTHLIIK